MGEPVPRAVANSEVELRTEGFLVCLGQFDAASRHRCFIIIMDMASRGDHGVRDPAAIYLRVPPILPSVGCVIGRTSRI